MLYKDIHIGEVIEKIVKQKNIDIFRISESLNSNSTEIVEMYSMKSLNSELLLKWSKLLEYDLFRVYSQHLILYHPVNKKENFDSENEKSIPQFKKSIYTQEIIDFILEQIEMKKMTKQDVIEQYRIPKTTLYRWLYKYKI